MVMGKIMKQKFISSLLVLTIIALAPLCQAGIVAYWSFDDGSGGTASDSSGNGYHGTLNGSPAWVVGRIGGALQFDGADDYISTGQSLLNNLSEFTLACWINADAYTNKVGFVGQNDCIEFGFNSSDLRCWNTSVNGRVTGAWTLGTGTWHHVAVTGNSSGMRLYIDGEFFAGPSSSPGGGNYGSSGYTLKIGGGGIWDTSGNFFDGIMDEVYIYDHALTQPEIYNLFYDAEPKALNPTPADNSNHIDPNAMITWGVAGATNPSFEISIGTDPNCDDVLVDHNTALDMNYTPSPGLLGLATKYYWRVDVHEDGNEFTGDVWSFTTGGKATNPVPTDGEPNVSPIADVSWTGDSMIASYDVYFAEVNDSLVFVDNYIDPNTTMENLAYAIGLQIVDGSTTYQWRVDTRNSGGSLIATGDVWIFTTKELNCEDIIQLGYKKTADMNNDCQIDMADLAILAGQWMLYYDPNE